MADGEADKRGADHKPESSKGYGMDAEDLKQAWDIRTFLVVELYRIGLPKQRSNSLQALNVHFVAGERTYVQAQPQLRAIQDRPTR